MTHSAKACLGGAAGAAILETLQKRPAGVEGGGTKPPRFTQERGSGRGMVRGNVLREESRAGLGGAARAAVLETLCKGSPMGGY